MIYAEGAGRQTSKRCLPGTFPFPIDRRNEEQVFHPLGSLLAGTTDPNIPVHPLHASFYDFLTNKTCSASAVRF